MVALAPMFYWSIFSFSSFERVLSKCYVVTGTVFGVVSSCACFRRTFPPNTPQTGDSQGGRLTARIVITAVLVVILVVQI